MKTTNVKSENLKGKENLGSLSLYLRIILNWFLNKSYMRVLNGFNWFRKWPSDRLL
jgi:hypothetical protein